MLNLAIINNGGLTIRLSRLEDEFKEWTCKHVDMFFGQFFNITVLINFYCSWWVFIFGTEKAQWIRYVQICGSSQKTNGKNCTNRRYALRNVINSHKFIITPVIRCTHIPVIWVIKRQFILFNEWRRTGFPIPHVPSWYSTISLTKALRKSLHDGHSHTTGNMTR